jgi:lipoprotein-anchoring transpeptidase ErfK/SrfK
MINNATWSTDMGKGQYPVYAKAQILLDRSHSSPGAIDGISGRNMLKAIAAFELMQGLPVDGVLDIDVWDRLLLADISPVIQPYTLTEADIKGPYADTIPHDYADQAKMKGLYYTSVAEMLGERFHMDQTFLQQLNSGKNFNTVGEQIWVTDTGPEDTRPLKLLIAHKGASELYGFDENNQMIVAYPATIGSNDTPSPTGDVTIRAIAAKPWYGYNPKNFIQGKNMTPLSLPPGPNNPVGSMWIALSKKSYGIHGTPSPSKIDKTRSHGCVRLTNWDAEALAKRIKVGVPVQFRGTPR